MGPLLYQICLTVQKFGRWTLGLYGIKVADGRDGVTEDDRYTLRTFLCLVSVETELP